ncbi:MAG TPA: hypothetical protein VNL77_12445 [Roseiflexaceae bacterium]|nr:hypothetical protein [Roseiflexaceae bacterium]
MAHNPHYTRYRPRWYRARVPIFWWVRKWAYVRFVLRELTSVFVGIYALLLLAQVWALMQGPQAYAGFIAWLRTPGAIVLHLVTLAAVVFHSVTWFSIAPSVLVVHVRGRRVPGALIVALNYLAWLAVSAVIALILLRV